MLRCKNYSVFFRCHGDMLLEHGGSKCERDFDRFEVVWPFMRRIPDLKRGIAIFEQRDLAQMQMSIRRRILTTQCIRASVLLRCTKKLTTLSISSNADPAVEATMGRSR